jgi:flagellar hook-length control protein FliK
MNISISSSVLTTQSTLGGIPNLDGGVLQQFDALLADSPFVQILQGLNAAQNYVFPKTALTMGDVAGDVGKDKTQSKQEAPQQTGEAILADVLQGALPKTPLSTLATTTVKPNGLNDSLNGDEKGQDTVDAKSNAKLEGDGDQTAEALSLIAAYPVMMPPVMLDNTNPVAENSMVDQQGGAGAGAGAGVVLGKVSDTVFPTVKQGLDQAPSLPIDSPAARVVAGSEPQLVDSAASQDAAAKASPKVVDTAAAGQAVGVSATVPAELAARIDSNPVTVALTKANPANSSLQDGISKDAPVEKPQAASSITAPSIAPSIIPSIAAAVPTTMALQESQQVLSKFAKLDSNAMETPLTKAVKTANAPKTFTEKLAQPEQPNTVKESNENSKAAEPVAEPSFGQMVGIAPATPNSASLNTNTVVSPVPINKADGSTAAVPEQVTVAIRRGVNEGSSHMRIRLSPDELGGIDIRMEVDADHHVRAVLTIDRPETYELLQRDSEQLRALLADSGLKLADNAIRYEQRDTSIPSQGLARDWLDQSGQQSGQQFGQQAGQQGWQQGSQQDFGSAAYAQPNSVLADASISSNPINNNQAVNHDGRLNLSV